MSFLKVVVTDGPEPIAKSANGFDLGSVPSGVLTGLFRQKRYPYAHNYLAYLRREGWIQVSSRSGNGNERVYFFEGNGRYKIFWVSDNWVPDQSLWIRSDLNPREKWVNA